jgi:adenosylcobinamide-GDP ribazoletransferase
MIWLHLKRLELVIKIRNEFELFLTAIMFFTRIPVPEIFYSEEKLNKSSKYFPLVGILIGLIASLSFMLASFIFSKEISILISILLTVIITGGFHEDGFTDFIDGIGGGYTKEKIILIMKDSRIGAFGAMAIFFMFSFKFFLIKDIPEKLIPFALVLANSISRLNSISILMSLNYLSEDGKSKPLATRMSLSDFILCFVFGVLPVFLFFNLYILILFPILIFCRYLFILYLKKNIGGYTGDTLGAFQVISEILVYFSLIGLLKWKFI